MSKETISMLIFSRTIMRSHRWVLMTGLGLLALCDVSISDGAAALEASNVQQPQILVTGEGSATIVPDLAQVRGGVSTRAATVKEASEANARTMTTVINKLVEAGIDRKDIQTAQFSIQPVYASSEPRAEQKLVGYSVSNQVVAKIRKIEQVSDILDRLIAAGANNVWNLEFMASDSSKALDQARRAAVADARRKAELYANAAGVTLGPVVSIAEDSASAPAPVFRRDQLAVHAGGMAPPISAGEDTLRVSVSVGFALAR
jgi:uncharacterized protein YggE